MSGKWGQRCFILPKQNLLVSVLSDCEETSPQLDECLERTLLTSAPEAADVAKAGDGVAVCPYAKKCGGCDYQGIPYAEQLAKKQKTERILLDRFAKVEPILGAVHPEHYRNKVHGVFGYDKKGNVFTGIYEEKSHRIVPVPSCMIEDEKANDILRTLCELAKSFKIRIYDEDRGTGMLRHALIRVGRNTGEIMVVLVVTDPVFPSKNNFTKELRRRHPEITTVVLNINNRDTSMVLGERNIVLYGKGYIEDVLCGLRFRISPSSFYQINPEQTEVLYGKAMEFAGMTGKERVIDAYCGIGTIGMCAAAKAGEVIGVELNRDAVRDAIANAKANGIRNIRFESADAGAFMTRMAADGETADVVFMDPPRSGSTSEFITAVNTLKPARVVYVSCDPETLARDLALFVKKGWKVERIQPVEMFPYTKHIETVVQLSK
ncbi:MAG: 23S rRNA (uracil(1939)-C(5))-methyltransferase RlmD [Lachnospiraceae bacterium]|nr:23S rRNA (uracil(1939)-C(5))-methyltransferase RlmD [Lachnospiraceae bacterium]